MFKTNSVIVFFLKMSVIYEFFIKNNRSVTQKKKKIGLSKPALTFSMCLLVYNFSGLLSIVFDLEQLIDMASIGTLQTYMTICVCVLLLRYVQYVFYFKNAHYPTIPVNRFFFYKTISICSFLGQVLREEKLTV